MKVIRRREGIEPGNDHFTTGPGLNGIMHCGWMPQNRAFPSGIYYGKRGLQRISRATAEMLMTGRSISRCPF